MRISDWSSDVCSSDLEALLTGWRPDYAVVDLKLGNASGLSCVQTLRAADPAMRIVVLTGFASIATAVEAIKLGASYYLAKPSHTDDIEARSEERRVGKECVSTCSTRSARYHK